MGGVHHTAATALVRRRSLLLGGWSAAIAAVGAVAAHRRRAPAGLTAAPRSTAPATSPAVAPGGDVAAAAPPSAPGGGAVAPAVSHAAPVIGIDPPGGDGVPDRTPLTGEALVLHVARRATFGPTPDLLDEIRVAGPDAWLDAQLAPADIDDSAVEALLATAPEYGALVWSNHRAADAPQFVARVLRHATMLRFVHSRRQLYEVLVDVWSNHLNVWISHPEASACRHTDDREVIRRHAMGRFSDLLLASARSPAMLLYLDNASSAAPAVNENYGRELLELHTVGVDGQFTEADVRGVAAVMSGWTVGGDRTFVFEPAMHDPSPATVLGWSTPGTAGPGAVADGESLLAHLASHPATARRVATVLARRFVADDPAADTIDEGAAAYLASGTDIPSTLRAIFANSAFRAGGGAKLRRPLDAAAAILRATGATIEGSPSNPASAELDAHLARMGQRLFDRPVPDGYADRATAWASSSSLLARWSFAAAVAHDRITGVRIDPERLLGGADPATAGEAVDAVAVALLGHPLAPERRATVVAATGTTEGSPAAATAAFLRPVAALVLSAPEAEFR